MSYDIELPNPFGFGINIKESDDRLPSIGCEVELKLEVPRGTFSYTAKDIWFECSVIDDFLAQLKKLNLGEATKAEFYDIDREIVLSITKDQVQLSVHRIHSEIGSGYLDFKCEADNDIIAQHIEHLEIFAKWW